MEQSSSESIKPDSNSGKREAWQNSIKQLEEAAEEHTFLATAALFGLILMKVIWMASGNIETALGIFNSAGPVTVVVGGLVSAFPLVLAIALGFFFLNLARRFPSWPERFTWLTGLLGAAGCFFLTPWPIAAATALVGLFSGLTSEIKRKKVVQRGLLSVLVLASVFLILNPLLYAVWLPHEILTVPKLGTTKQSDKQYITGYVLSDDDGWITLLQTPSRTIARFRGDEVAARTLCQGQAVAMPGAPRWYKNADSPWKALMPGVGGALSPCQPSETS